MEYLYQIFSNGVSTLQITEISQAYYQLCQNGIPGLILGKTFVFYFQSDNLSRKR